MSFPTRSQIFKDPVWTVVKDVSRPALDTFYQVDFSFSSNVNRWLDVSAAKFGGIPYNRKAQNLVSGSTRLGGGQVARKLMLLCVEAEIPGTSYLTTQTDGHHQGISETFPTYRQFPPLNLTFYLDADHVVLEVFESWMRYINPISTKSDEKKNNAYTRFNYPSNYKERLHLSKYERDFKNGSKMSQYEFVNLWPTNMTSMRVNYGTSDVIRVAVQFAYDRFFTQFNVLDSRPFVERIPPEIRDTDTIINSNKNKWWTPQGPFPLGMNDQLRSIQSGLA